MSVETQKKYEIELLTPCFCKIGPDKPEIRGASIRGMIREWKRLLGGKQNLENIWGGKGSKASKVGIDLKDIEQTKSKHQLLPHKGGTSPHAVDNTSSFTLILNRLVGCTKAEWNEAKQDVENWLVIGCLGQRSNRAAGSVWCESIGISSQNHLSMYVKSFSKEFYISSSFDDPLLARETASDTTENSGLFGSFKPRKPSPTKMKVIKFSENDYRILFFSERAGMISEVEKELKGKHDSHRWDNIDFIKV